MENRLASMYFFRIHPEAGGLMSYSWDSEELYRKLAQAVAKILSGANPADIPVERPTRFNLVINMKTAKALDLNIAPSLLLQANTVIK